MKKVWKMKDYDKCEKCKTFTERVMVGKDDIGFPIVKCKNCYMQDEYDDFIKENLKYCAKETISPDCEGHSKFETATMEKSKDGE